MNLILKNKLFTEQSADELNKVLMSKVATGGNVADEVLPDKILARDVLCTPR